MDWYVTLCALIAGVICFVIYVLSAGSTMLAKPNQAAANLASTAKTMAETAEPKATAQDYKGLLEAAAKLTDSLSKAGPTLVSLIGAILLFLIAAVSSGALKNPLPPASAGTSAAAAAR